VVFLLALGNLIQRVEEHRKAILGVAGAADSAFLHDRTRLAQIERFLVFVFKLDEAFAKKAEKPDIQNQVAKKKDDLKN
jgi:hypothetical protein